MFPDQLQGLCCLKVSDHCDRSVIRPVVGIVELPQLLDRDPLDITPPSDGGVVVRVGDDRGRGHLLIESRSRIVLAALKLVTDHGHLRFTILFSQEQIPHAIGLEFDCQLKMVAWQVLVVIGAVQPGGGVVDAADPVHQGVEAFSDAGMKVFRALEHQMLKQVGGAGCAGDLIAGSDPVGDHEREHRRGAILEQEDVQVVAGEPVFRDSGHGTDVFHAIHSGRSGQSRTYQQ